MKKLIAVHMLILASQVRGVLDEIFPGKAFLATPEEVTFLVGRGAARLPSQAEHSLPVTLRAGQNVKGDSHEDEDTTGGPDDSGDSEQSRAVTDEEGDGSVSLGDLTVAQLTEMAAAEGVDLGAAKKKAEIIAIIEAAWNERAGAGELI